MSRQFNSQTGIELTARKKRSEGVSERLNDGEGTVTSVFCRILGVEMGLPVFDHGIR